jgi:phage-related protein
MQKAFAAEFHYDNFNIQLLQNRGSKKNYVLRWDKNIGSPDLSLTTSNLYTHVVAYAKLTAIIEASGGQAERRYEVQVCSDPKRIRTNDNTLKIMRIYMFDASDYFNSKEIYPRRHNEYAIAKALLNEAADDYVQTKAQNELQTTENANLKVNFLPALDEMTALGLGDTVDVMLKGGRTVEAKITATEFDCLAERWTSIELGEERMKLADYIAKKR